MVPIINYLLALMIVFLGLHIGVFLGKLAPEEYKQYRKIVNFFKRFYRYPKARGIILGAVIAFSAYKVNYFIIAACLIFLYHIDTGVFFYDDNRKQSYSKVTNENILFLVVSVLLYATLNSV
jgi:hypothetical protein